jgi:hypothetical protein
MSNQAQTISPSEVGASIFGMLSGMFSAISNTVITTAVKGTKLIDKTLNVAINSVSAAENISEAVEKRSKTYGEGIVRNGKLAERETTVKYVLRLRNLEKQEAAVDVSSVNVDSAKEEPAEVDDDLIRSAVPASPEREEV